MVYVIIIDDKRLQYYNNYVLYYRPAIGINDKVVCTHIKGMCIVWTQCIRVENSLNLLTKVKKLMTKGEHVI